jgi:predicted amidophosphoribosyltransferase
MPCYRCGTRQVDPDRGESPWRRGVRGDRQVLICPDCQAAYDWIKELDRCQVCGSAHLVRRLGEVECRDCGAVGQPAAALSDAVVVSDALVMANAAVTEAAVADLADEVERALAKVLGPSRRRHAMS